MTDVNRRLDIIGEAQGLSPARIAAGKVAAEHYASLSDEERTVLFSEAWEELTQTPQWASLAGLLSIHKITHLAPDQVAAFGSVSEPHVIEVRIGFTQEVTDALEEDE